MKFYSLIFHISGKFVSRMCHEYDKPRHILTRQEIHYKEDCGTTKCLLDNMSGPRVSDSRDLELSVSGHYWQTVNKLGSGNIRQFEKCINCLHRHVHLPEINFNQNYMFHC